MDQWTKIEGSSSPLGVTWVEQDRAYNFALYSKHATGVTLLLYSDQDFVNPVYQYRMSYLKNKSGRVWYCRIPVTDMADARYYAYTVEGPFGLVEGHRFDPQKLLLDPYAKAVFFPDGFSRESASRPGPNAGKVPLGVIDTDHMTFDWLADRRPCHTSDAIIYELHIKGFTERANSGVSAEKRGTFAGLVEKIPYPKGLGVTAVELLPIYQYDPVENNYWSYMTLNLFAPHHAYAGSKAPGEQINEFRIVMQMCGVAIFELLESIIYKPNSTHLHHYTALSGL